MQTNVEFLSSMNSSERFQKPIEVRPSYIYILRTVVFVLKKAGELDSEFVIKYY